MVLCGRDFSKIPPIIKNQAVNLQNKSNTDAATGFFFYCCSGFIF
jgi:hypothetical protein